MTRTEFIQQLEELYSDGLIDDDAMDVLVMIADDACEKGTAESLLSHYKM